MSTILIVGDVMIDEYVHVHIDRISPEAPIPVMRYLSTSASPGGAANVAANVRSLGEEARLVGVVGIGCPLTFSELNRCVWDRSRTTTVKKRFVADRGQQVARLDIEQTDDIKGQIEEALIRTVLDDMPGCDAVIISDYCKGVVTERVAKAVIEASGEQPVIVDTKRRDWSRFHGAYAFTPNEKEWLAAVNVPTESSIVTTLGDRGVMLDGEIIPAQEVRRVADVTGAGDTFVAALTLSIADGHSLGSAIRFANRAAGVAVSRQGTTAVRLTDV